MLEHTISWYKGEIFEARFILAFGIATVMVAILFFYLGNTAYAKALLLPMMVTGVIFTVIGGSMLYSNQKKMVYIEENFQKNNIGFVQAEKKRVEDFQYLYPLSLCISAACFVLAVAFLGFTKNISLHATAVALAIFGLAFITIDYFSKERASIYYDHITNFLYQDH